MQWQADIQLQKQHFLAVITQLKQDKQQLMSGLATAACAADNAATAAVPGEVSNMLEQPAGSIRSSTQPQGGNAGQLNQAPLTAEPDVRAAQDEAQQLRRQLHQQEQELMHIKR